MCRNRLALSVLLITAACGDDDGGAGPPDAAPPAVTLDDFLPPLPAPDGTAQSVFAGAITAENAAVETIPGPATSGLVGDYYLRNSRARFVVQAPSRFVGVNPFGGTVLDAALVGEDGSDVTVDQLGEVGFLYLAGRTCDYQTVDTVVDGSGGGAAAIRMRGRSAVNDWINLPGMGILPLADELDPNVEDGVECAVTYVLGPDSDSLEVAWTLFNGGDARVRGPFAMFSDGGGEVFQWSPGIGFFELNLSDLSTLTQPTPARYQAIVAPGVLYGLVPKHADPATPNAATSILGVSVVIFQAMALLDILGPEAWALDLQPDGGATFEADVVIGRSPSDVEAAYRRATGGGAPTAVSGTVTFTPSGMPGAGARVGAYDDVDGDGALDDTDTIASWFDVDATGAWSGVLPPGSYLLRADVPDVARSSAVPLTVADAAVTAPAVTLADVARFDFTVEDAADGAPIPARLTVIGEAPVPIDKRVRPPFDRRFGVVATHFSLYGTSDPAVVTDPADAPLLLPAGGPYKILVSRGTEWTIDEIDLSSVAAGETQNLGFTLERVVDTAGYVATEFHQHAYGSPDSSVPFDMRLRTLVAEGIEFFASTDHDYVADYDPIIDDLGLRGVIDGIPGVESTPFAWGHYIAYPLALDPLDPTNGAVDWADGVAGLDLLPAELFEALRGRGAEVVQACHPRGGNFQAYFDVTGLEFDFAGRSYGGRTMDLQTDAALIRQPENTDLFSDGFDTLEVWNGFSPDDTNGDGWRENSRLDLVLRDWMNFLSFGRIVAPIGNSDTHKRERDPPGQPRSLVAVPDDSATALALGIDDDVYATTLGATVPRDIVVTNGPMLRVSQMGGAAAIGRTLVPAVPGTVTLVVEATAPEWIGIDTIEVFANSTFDPVVDDDSALQPLKCWTSRTLGALDTCMTAPLPPESLAVTTAGGRRTAAVTVVLTSAEIAAATRAGARGEDAWIVIRVSGERPVFPVLIEGALTADNLTAVLSANTDAQLEAALGKSGVPAGAFTAPILVDFDGGGWRAPFAP